MEPTWIAVFPDETIHQYPETGEDNTMRLKEVFERVSDLATFFVTGQTSEGQPWRIGIDMTNRGFIIGDMALPFWSPDETVKLVYFLTRHVTANAATEELPFHEHERIYTVGYEDSNGKVFLNILADQGTPFFSNNNP